MCPLLALCHSHLMADSAFFAVKSMQYTNVHLAQKKDYAKCNDRYTSSRIHVHNKLFTSHLSIDVVENMINANGWRFTKSAHHEKKKMRSTICALVSLVNYELGVMNVAKEKSHELFSIEQVAAQQNCSCSRQYCLVNMYSKQNGSYACICTHADLESGYIA